MSYHPLLRSVVRVVFYAALIALIFAGYTLWAFSHVPRVIVVTPTPVITVTPILARVYPLIPPGGYHGPSYSHLAPWTLYTYNGTTYVLIAGDQGRLWGMTAQGKQVLLYGARSQYQ